MERKLAAILFTDIVGYTILMGRDEVAGRRVRARHEALVRPLVARYHGRWVEEKGDESLSIFPSALDAVNCALAIQAQLERDDELSVRIGVHLGDVTLEAGRVYGDGVNVASRIRALAQPGGIAVSGPVCDSIKNQANVESASLGEQTLKHVAEPILVYSLTGTAAPPAEAAAGSSSSRRRLGVAAAILVGAAVTAAIVWWPAADTAVETPSIRSLAVLPLDDPSNDSEQKYFTFGMTEALIAELGKLDGLRVISRTSVTPYEDTTLPLGQIAAELGVEAVIEGSVMRVGEQVRITVQLIDARSDAHLWAESYQRDLSDVLALQEEVARAIAEQIQFEVSPLARSSASTRKLNPEAHIAYLKGYYFQMKRTRSDTLKAISYFQEAIRLDPENPLGYSGMADEYSCAPTHSWSIPTSEQWPSVPREMIGRARENSLKAVALDPRSGAARNSIALVRTYGDWDWPGAEAEFHKALELTPGRAWAHTTYAHLLSMLHRFDEALPHLETARSLDPLRVEVIMDLAALHTWRGELEKAYDWWQEAREIDPGYPGLHQSVITGFCGTDAHEEAIAALEGATTKHPNDPPIMGELAFCHAVSGQPEIARDLLKQIEAQAGTMYVSPVSRAAVYAGLGELDLAFAALEQGFTERDFLLLYLGLDPTWKSLRADPRYADLMERIGLPWS
jgi:TolB-like protein/class 3 adenylate cyclase/Tfp pilus assembly protein PilF